MWSVLGDGALALAATALLADCRNPRIGPGVRWSSRPPFAHERPRREQHYMSSCAGMLLTGSSAPLPVMSEHSREIGFLPQAFRSSRWACARSCRSCGCSMMSCRRRQEWSMPTSSPVCPCAASDAAIDRRIGAASTSYCTAARRF